MRAGISIPIRTVTVLIVIIYAGVIGIDFDVTARGAGFLGGVVYGVSGFRRASPGLFGQLARYMTCWAGIGYYFGADGAGFVFKANGLNAGKSRTDCSGAH